MSIGWVVSVTPVLTNAHGATVYMLHQYNVLEQVNVNDKSPQLSQLKYSAFHAVWRLSFSNASQD